MMKPVVDYRKLRLSNLRSPEYSHVLLLLGWVGYFILYVLTENLIPPERCHVMHCWLDDVIPFSEYFLVFYAGWYLLVAASLAWFLFYDVDSFKKLQTYIIITQIIAVFFYIFFPSRQDLRPTEFARDNVFTKLMTIIYTVDTSTGVCPSLHVAYSLGIASTWLKKKDAPRALKVFITLFVCGICVSVSFVKQHSVLDILAALPVGLVAELIVFRDYWKAKFRKPTKA